MRRLRSLLIIVVFFFASCSSTELEGLDSMQWKEDKGGCNGYRTSVLPYLQEQKEQMQQMDVKELRSLLGTPDKHELEERNRRRFTYLADTGPHCNDGDPLPDTESLTIRIGPLGEIIEITFY